MKMSRLLFWIPILLVNFCSLVLTRKSSVDIFVEYLRIDTSNPENLSKYEEYAVDFWRELAISNGFPFAVYEPAGLPICVITLYGSQKDLPSIMLNSHMDVVTANESEWTYAPFAATVVVDEDTIYGRGAQDTKALGIQQFETLLYFKENNITLPRTLHLTLMPDEETGGKNGMKPFVETDEFKNLNVGLIMDEGLALNDDNFYVTNRDRRPWQLEISMDGEGGHGSQMPDIVAVNKLTRLLNSLQAFRDQQIQIQKNSDPYDYGAYTSINVNIIKGGSQVNVIPLTFQVGIDMRLCEHCSADDYNKMIESWLKDANITSQVSYIRKEDISYTTAADDTDPFWTAMVDVATKELGKNITPIVCPATSDCIHVRKHGYKAFGFSPNVNMIPRMHNKDEFMIISTFLEGVEQYRKIIERVASVV